MSYFDHVQCHTCGARIDPEKLVPGPGGMPGCPHCNAELNLKDLFGVKDSFVGMHDDQGNDHTLDDLLGNDLYDGRYIDGRAPEQAPTPQAPRQAPRSSGSQRSSNGATPSLRSLTGSGTMVPTGKRDAWEDDDHNPSGNPPSAADLLRSMKKKK